MTLPQKKYIRTWLISTLFVCVQLLSANPCDHIKGLEALRLLTLLWPFFMAGTPPNEPSFEDITDSNEVIIDGNPEDAHPEEEVPVVLVPNLIGESIPPIVLPLAAHQPPADAQAAIEELPQALLPAPLGDIQRLEALNGNLIDAILRCYPLPEPDQPPEPPNFEAIELALVAGANPHIIFAHFRTPFFWEILNRDPVIFRLLYQYGFQWNFNAPGHVEGFPYLGLHGNVEILEAFLRESPIELFAATTFQDILFQTLHQAAMHGQTAVIQCVLNYYHPPILKSIGKSTLLHAAAMNGHGDILCWLLASLSPEDRTVVLSAQDNDKRTPADLAYLYGFIPALILLGDKSLYDKIQYDSWILQKLKAWILNQMPDDLNPNLPPVNDHKPIKPYNQTLNDFLVYIKENTCLENGCFQGSHLSYMIQQFEFLKECIGNDKFLSLKPDQEVLIEALNGAILKLNRLIQVPPKRVPADYPY